MKNKKHITTYIILMILPVLIAIAALFVLPDQVPAHYGFNGEVDRWGSKYEVLILPITSVVFGVLMMIIAKFSSHNENSNNNNEKITLVTGECCLVLFLILQIYFLYLDFHAVSDIYSLPIDMGHIIAGFLGVFCLITGNIMPKAKMNSFAGFRISWSMKNEEIWKKCQRFAGIVSMIFGVILILSAFFTSGMTAVIISIGLILLMSVIDTVYAFKISHNAE